jgi:hypothetical protein
MAIQHTDISRALGWAVVVGAGDMMFHVGQKVVCVDDEFGFADRLSLRELPVKGNVYIIRDMPLGMAIDGSRRIGLLLQGIKNNEGPRGIEHCFNPMRFRPIVERKTDISIFRLLLNPANHKELA